MNLGRLFSIRRESGWICAVLLAAVLMLSGLPHATAQSSRGTITGIVTDAQGAAIPNATVEIEAAQTGVKRSTTTNEAGLYRFDAVDLGDYTVRVTATGFAGFAQRGVAVAAGAVVSKDARLEVGETRSTIEVQAEAVQLQTEASTRGGSIVSVAVTELPVATRDVAQLALVLPGVSTNRFGSGVGTFSVNGSRGRSNNFMIDGVDNNDASVAGQLTQIINPDAVAEVSVQTSNFDAEYGRAAGGVINTITKSGTNDLHGTLNYLLDVTNDDSISNTLSKDPTIISRGKLPYGIEQFYGGTVGGPIRKNKTFFFGAFQDDRRRVAITNNLVTPTAAGWATINQLYPAGKSANIDLYRKIAGQPDAIATSDPYPVAMGDNRPSVEFGTKITTTNDTFLDRQLMGRVDHVISAKDQLSFRYLYDKQNDPLGGASPFFPGFATSFQYPSQNLAASETHVFSSTLTNELRLSFNRANLDYGINTENAMGPTLPYYSIGSGITSIGVQTNLPQGRVVNNYALQETMSKVYGAHSFRFGTTINQQRTRQFAPIRSRGEVDYTTTTGYSNFANFADDYSGSTGVVQHDFGSPAYYPNFTRQAYFFQDRWRLNNDVTLTLGIRYEYFGLPMNSLKKAAYSGIFNLDPVSLTGPYSDFTKVDADKNNFAPAIGIAWSPRATSGILGILFGEKKAVIRTGYQIGYDSFFNNIASNAATATPNVVATSITSNALTTAGRGVANWSSYMPTVARAPLPSDSQTLILKNLVNPYSQRWSFGYQRELPASFLMDVSYVGSQGVKLYANEDFNPSVPLSMRIGLQNTYTNPGRLDNLQGSRLTRTNGGNSTYEALQFGLDHRMSHGMLLKFAYTWSKMIDNSVDVFGLAGSNTPQNTAVPSIYGGLHSDKSISQLDRTYRVNISYIYDLPFMSAQKGIVGKVVGGWKLSGQTTFESGVPMTVTNGADADGIGGNYDRPNYNPNGQAGGACTAEQLKRDRLHQPRHGRGDRSGPGHVHRPAGVQRQHS